MDKIVGPHEKYGIFWWVISSISICTDVKYAAEYQQVVVCR